MPSKTKRVHALSTRSNMQRARQRPRPPQITGKIRKPSHANPQRALTTSLPLVGVCTPTLAAYALWKPSLQKDRSAKTLKKIRTRLAEKERVRKRRDGVKLQSSRQGRRQPEGMPSAASSAAGERREGCRRHNTHSYGSFFVSEPPSDLLAVMYRRMNRKNEIRQQRLLEQKHRNVRRLFLVGACTNPVSVARSAAC